MITICGIKDCDVALYDEVWYITNYTPNMKVGTFHHKELAPFIHDFLQYKNGNLNLSQLLQNYGNALYAGHYDEAINDLITYAEDKWICLVCYCNSYTECHRGVLYNYLLAKKVPVQLLS